MTRPELSRVRRPTIPEPLAIVPPVPVIPLPEIAPIPQDILGRGLVETSKLTGFLLYINPRAGELAKNLAGLYVEEAALEGVNHDVAFAQMCLETGFLKFGGLVTVDMNNFCGLGSIGPGQPGVEFSNPRTGVRAHIQHLKAYATSEPLNQPLVDPRYRYVRYGSAPQIKGLVGTWAADTQYAEKINGILERLYTFVFRGPPPEAPAPEEPMEITAPVQLSPADFIEPIKPPVKEPVSTPIFTGAPIEFIPPITIKPAP